MSRRSPAAGFDVLAPHYRWLEWIAFGGDLERARFQNLNALAGCRRILVLGEGDGRFLARLVGVTPAEIVCIEASSAMVARAAARIPDAARARVRFVNGDARALDFSGPAYDAVVTLFFLDCFPGDQVLELARRISAVLQPGAVWVYADFALPAHGWRRARARVWLAVLYAFFRWQTSLPARQLPPAEAIIQSLGFRTTECRELQQGLLRTVIFRR